MKLAAIFLLLLVLTMTATATATEYAYHRTYQTHNSFDKNFETLRSQELSDLYARLRSSFNINYNPDIEIRMTSRPTKEYCKFEMWTKQKLDRVNSMYHYIEITGNQVTSYSKFDVSVPRFRLGVLQRVAFRVASQRTRAAYVETFNYEQGLLLGNPSAYDPCRRY